MSGTRAWPGAGREAGGRTKVRGARGAGPSLVAWVAAGPGCTVRDPASRRGKWRLAAR